MPYFPGARSSEIPNAPYPCLDDNLGRFDHSRNPQFFLQHKPYFAFIVRSESGQYNDGLPENVPPYLVWHSADLPHYDMGGVQLDYWKILNARVQNLSVEGQKLAVEKNCMNWPGFIESLPQIESELLKELSFLYFDEFVLKLAPLQRRIKELAAWVTMGSLLRSFPFSPNLSTENSNPVNVREELIGLWANRLRTDMATWFWNFGRVPMFICHQIGGARDDP
ncbi:hypothetical protein VKT23_019600 [Stygiomarasmius scandens]|uniref:Uncharacterized protein n=1 Tax=Marasmiellus scandens TaxID=2682957 RepID=A0ABR1IMK5_9AGAR